MPKLLAKNKVISIAGFTYQSLLKKVSQELSELEFFLKRRTAESYWKVGWHIHEHLLKNRKRAGYGKTLYERLAKDVDYDKTTLMRTTQFYRAYPILVPGRELTWSHYRRLITVKDKNQRKELEQQILQKNWDTQKLQEYLNVKRELSAPANNTGSVAQLSLTRGRLHTYRIVPANKPLAKISPLVLDLGFRLQHEIPGGVKAFKENDLAELVFQEERLVDAAKVTAKEDELFTYQACVDKIIDADTYVTSFEFHLKVSLSQKLRLRGINCPEIETPEGKKAKRFVESRLKGCEFIIVKTTKDRSDKFDRYLADIFYLAGATDPALVAREGTHLNQELLNERLAVKY